MIDPADPDVAKVKQLRAEGMSIRGIGLALHRGDRFVSEVLNSDPAKNHANMAGSASKHESFSAIPPFLPEPAPEAGGICLPDPISKPMTHVQVDDVGWWWVLNDTHMPMHDKSTIEAGAAEAKAKGIKGILLNGDILDMFCISPFFRVPTKDRFVDEIEMGRTFLAWLRSKFPHARIIYREGNHEFRLTRYVADRAAALYDLEEVHLPFLLRLKEHGVEWVQDKKKVMLGKLTTLHGHEFRSGLGAVVNPARLAFLRASSTVLVGHHHRTSEHQQRSLDDKNLVCWSVGCACYLHCDYDPYNQWNHGYAMVEVMPGGNYSVHNRRVINGVAA
jgi:predicted phosphodiesterase